MTHKRDYRYETPLPDPTATTGSTHSARAQCKGKIQHPDRKTARQHRNRLGSGVSIYRCPHCGWFHVGTNRLQGGL